ncbi:LANO_0G16182g1_1 [Lachancea nothofagi CBS 11611]|uniref:LANO_0G16182g1_1 n=1 Tax=Lachancea nothofagi CBS 11611 TaxID=1266666 RepID=A0A1G4KKI1_9SACH|nr:LANO_0G16182g1_1 [Lachancea nothofagi CBS 11611]
MSNSKVNAIPESVPLHRSTVQELHSWRTRDISAIFNETRSQFSNTLNQLAETDLKDASSLSSLAQVYKDFQNLESQQKVLQGNITDAKTRYRTQSDELPPVTWENWDAYREGRLQAPKLSNVFADVEREKKGNARAMPNDSLSRLFKALPHILADPQCILPDERTDDDLQIEGGRIELTCPITCMPFKKPMISRKCGHVFDFDGIEQHLAGQPTKDCPQSGCGQKVAMKDLIRDEVMELRCKVAATKSTSAKAEEALHTV